jgi:hypothetical protein
VNSSIFLRWTRFFPCFFPMFFQFWWTWSIHGPFWLVERGTPRDVRWRVVQWPLAWAKPRSWPWPASTMPRRMGFSHGFRMPMTDPWCSFGVYWWHMFPYIAYMDPMATLISSAENNFSRELHLQRLHVLRPGSDRRWKSMLPESPKARESPAQRDARMVRRLARGLDGERGPDGKRGAVGPGAAQWRDVNVGLVSPPWIHFEYYSFIMFYQQYTGIYEYFV